MLVLHFVALSVGHQCVHPAGVSLDRGSTGRRIVCSMDASAAAHVESSCPICLFNQRNPAASDGLICAVLPDIANNDRSVTRRHVLPSSLPLYVPSPRGPPAA